MIRYTKCPLCSSSDIHPALTFVDYTVSQQPFAVLHCNACTARFTQDIPSQTEIGVYYQADSYVSHTDTHKGLVNRLYHLVRSRTLQTKKNWVSKHTGRRTGHLLDIGSGTGAFLNCMQTAQWQCTGLEPDESARKIASTRYGIEAKLPEQLFQLAPQSFDAITMWHVLEHVHTLHDYVQQLASLIKPDGKIFIAVPNYTSLDADLYQAHWAAYDVPRHLYHFSPASMEQLLSKHQLKLVAIQPMWYDSFYVSMLSEKYKNGKGNFIKACWNGLRSNLKAFRNPRYCSSLVYVIEKK